MALSSRAAFFEDIYFPEEKGGGTGGTGDGLGEDYGVEKITKIDKGIGHKFW